MDITVDPTTTQELVYSPRKRHTRTCFRPGSNMTEYESSKLDHEKHLLLDQPLLRLPNELSRHNLKAAQIQIKTAQDKINDIITSGIKSTAAVSATASSSAATEPKLGQRPEDKASDALDAAINRLNTLKRKLSSLNESTEELYRQSAARVQHLEDLYKIPSLSDVKYDEWSRIRLDRLLVDYLLRMGYTDSARALAEEKGVGDLVDLGAFESVGRIERSLRVDRKVEQALAWCAEHKATLKKMAPTVPAEGKATNGVGTSNGVATNGAAPTVEKSTGNTFEYELRLQQCVELARIGHGNDDYAKLSEARQFAAKYLNGHPDPEFKAKATLLLCFPPPHGADDGLDRESMDMDHPLAELYSPHRWTHLSQLFLQTHNQMYQLPSSPLLHMALTAGLSALKTPACHSKYLSPTSGLNPSASPSRSTSQPASERATSPPLRDNFDSMDGILSTSPNPLGNEPISAMAAGNVCPICSTELNKLAKHLPFAHHSKSHTEHDPVVLPNGRIYGRERLERLNEKLGVEKGCVRDPLDANGRSVLWEEVGKVYFL